MENVRTRSGKIHKAQNYGMDTACGVAILQLVKRTTRTDKPVACRNCLRIALAVKGK